MVSNRKNELIIIIIPICFDRRDPIVFSFRRFPLKRWNAAIIVDNADNSTVLLRLFKKKFVLKLLFFYGKKHILIILKNKKLVENLTIL